MPVPERHFVLGTPLKPPFPEGLQTAVVGMGCFWGAERIFWEAPGVVHDGRRLRGRLHAQPDLRGGLHRPHRPHRGRARGLRPGEDELRGAAADLLGGPRPDPGHAPGQRRRHPVPLGDLLRTTTSSARPPRRRATRYQSALTRRRLRRDHDRDRGRPARSTTPRTTTSSTWRKNPERLLRPRRHGRDLPGRRRRGREVHVPSSEVDRASSRALGSARCWTSHCRAPASHRRRPERAHRRQGALRLGHPLHVLRVLRRRRGQLVLWATPTGVCPRRRTSTRRSPRSRSRTTIFFFFFWGGGGGGGGFF